MKIPFAIIREIRAKVFWCEVMLLLTLQTGLRVSEVVGLRGQDIVLAAGAHVRCTGKGRKTRCIPLGKEIIAAIRLWLREQKAQPTDALFPSAQGKPMSRDGVEYLLAKHLAAARLRCPTLKSKRVSPHVLRHYADLRTMPTGEQASLFDAPFDRAFVIRNSHRTRHSPAWITGLSGRPTIGPQV